MIKKTKWTADTCGCSFEYEWDDDLLEAERTHTPVQSEKCAVHQTVADESHYETIVAENQGKNAAMSALLESMPSIAQVNVDKAGNTTKSFKENMKPNFYFDEARNLKIILPASTSVKERSAAQAAVSTQDMEVTLE